MSDWEVVEAAFAQLGWNMTPVHMLREREAREKRSEWREGLVNVLDHEGNYLGCLGTETWAWTLDGGIKALREREAQLDAKWTAENLGRFMWQGRAEAAEARVVQLERELAASPPRAADTIRMKELEAVLAAAVDHIEETFPEGVAVDPVFIAARRALEPRASDG